MKEHWDEIGLSQKERTAKRKWYQYTVPNIKEIFSYKEKIMVPYKAPSNRFALDREKRISSMDVYVCSIKRDREKASPVSIGYVLAILNSTLMDYAYVTFYGRRKKSEFEYYTGLIQEIPIHKPSSKVHKALGEGAEELISSNASRIELMRLFQKCLDSVAGKTKAKLKHYYENAQLYTITDKERLFKEQYSGAKLDQRQEAKYRIRRLGVEEVENSLVIEAEFQLDSEPARRELIVRIAVEDRDVRRFLLYSIKLFIENARRREVLAATRDILDGVLGCIEVDRLRTNIDENTRSIRSMMREFDAKAPTKHSVSELERQIWNKSKDIDEEVYSLYGLDAESKDMLREMYHCNTVSEYLDRLEEYVGVQDIQPE